MANMVAIATLIDILTEFNFEANSSVDYALITTMKQFYRVKHSINTLNDNNNKAKRNKE